MVQMPAPGSRCITAAVTFQSLKSPTTATDPAVAASSTNCTGCNASGSRSAPDPTNVGATACGATAGGAEFVGVEFADAESVDATAAVVAPRVGDAPRVGA